MDKRKKFLWVCLGFLGLIGLILTALPFTLSLRPPASAGENLPHIDVSDLKVGYYTVYYGTHLIESRDEAGDAYFILRFSEADFSVYWLPMRKGKYIMPPLDSGSLEHINSLNRA